MRDPPRPSLLLVAATLALVAAGCGGTNRSAASNRTTTPLNQPGPPNSAHIANPFKVVAHYSAKSLELNRPANLAIGPDGNLYVPDASQHITVISPEGKVLRRWGRPGKAPGEFHFVPHDPGAAEVSAGIAVGTNGRVYVDDSGNSRVEVFTSAGKFIRQFGSFGSGRGQIIFSNYLAVDGSGSVYVADDQQETLSKYSPSGALEWTTGGPASSDPDLVGHFHISSSGIDPHGRLVMANDDANRILYIDGSGHKVDAFGSPRDFRSSPCDATVNANGDTFVGSCQEPLSSPHYAEVFDPAHHLIGKWYPSPFAFSPRFGPHGEVFALGEDGSILRLRVNLSGA